MVDYKQMYFSLFAAMCDAIDAMDEENYAEAKNILISAQQKTEDAYINENDPE